MQNEVAVKVKDLVVEYGSVVAVDGLSFEVRRGEIYGLLGPNGAGKSSTIKALVGLVKPASGEVAIFGRPLTDEMAVKSLTGYVPEEVLLFDSLTPRNSWSSWPRCGALRLSSPLCRFRRRPCSSPWMWWGNPSSGPFR